MKHQSTKVGDVYNVIYDDDFRNTIIRALEARIAQGGNVGSALRALATFLDHGTYLVSPNSGDPIKYDATTVKGKLSERHLLSIGWYKLNVRATYQPCK